MSREEGERERKEEDPKMRLKLEVPKERERKKRLSLFGPKEEAIRLGLVRGTLIGGWALVPIRVDLWVGLPHIYGMYRDLIGCTGATARVAVQNHGWRHVQSAHG